MRTAVPIGAPRLGGRVARQLPLLALFLAIAATALLALAPLGWRAGWWHLRVAFYYLMPGAAYCGLAAVALAVLALVIGCRVGGARQIAIGILAVILGAATASVPWYYYEMRGIYPPINDITTDWVNPPEFSAILPLRQAAGANSAVYGGAKVSDQQRRAYPDIAPLMLELDAGKAFSRALDTAEQMGWTVVASDRAAGRIEATKRSRWFGFTDDIVIRVAAGGNGSRVDIRSVSRVGRGDFGVNAARVRAYLKALREASQGR